MTTQELTVNDATASSIAQRTQATLDLLRMQLGNPEQLGGAGGPKEPRYAEPQTKDQRNSDLMDTILDMFGGNANSNKGDNQ